MNHLLLCILCAFLWSISITIEKYYLLTKYKSYQLLFLRPIFFAIVSSMLVLSFDKNFSFLKNIDKMDILYVALGVCVNAFTLVIFFHLLKNNHTFETLSITHPLFICFSVLISYLFYNEKMNLKQLIGFIMVMIGVILVGYKK